MNLYPIRKPAQALYIYVATSWRNHYQPAIIQDLRDLGHEPYDFRNPPNEHGGFSWNEVDPKWKNWTPSEYREALHHQRAQDGFRSDYDAMKNADAFLLVNPCGKSAHLEAGWATGRQIPTLLYIPTATDFEPELMYALADAIAINWAEVIHWTATLAATL